MDRLDHPFGPLPLDLLRLDASAIGLSALRWLAGSKPMTWTLAQQIAAKIGDRILLGAVAPGERLREIGLAGEFRTSRGPIRDALQILAREGLVRVHPRRGAQATRLSPGEVRDLFEIRAALFSLVARRLALQRDPASLDALEHAVGRMERLVAGDARSYAESSFRASLLSATACGNDRLRDILTSLSLQTFRYTLIGLHSPERRRQSCALWKSTLRALRAGDADRAAEIGARRVRENGAAAARRLEQPATGRTR